MPVMQKLKFEKQRGEGQGWERLGSREERGFPWQELQLRSSGQKRPTHRPQPQGSARLYCCMDSDLPSWYSWDVLALAHKILQHPLQIPRT